MNASDIQKPILYEYFETTVDDFLANYQRSKRQGASDNIGFNREFFLAHFLNRVLPPRLSVKRGEIWDSHHCKSGQLEIIIIRNDCPALTFGMAETFLIEGVFGAIEVKSNLTREKLRKALKTLQKVSNLKSTEDVVVYFGDPEPLDRPLRCVFAYEGARFDTILNELSKPENQGVIDLISILTRGSLVKGDLILGFDLKKEYYPFHGKAASLSWLYYLLISHSTRFMGRSIDISDYFKPLEGW